MIDMEKAAVFTITEDTSEIRSLLETLNVSVIGEFLQKRPYPHKVGFLGPGRLKETEEELERLNPDAIIINGSLKPSQHHYLEMRFQKECVDRTGIILRIFADHAHTPEAIAQVTLARLRYELPFLREWIHKAKRGDRPGFLAGGAYATDVYFEHAKSQVRRIEQNLADLSRQREITRTKRHAKGYLLVSLAGYTNAGKSAIFNKLCGASVEVDDRLFSTLSTTTRKILQIPGNVLMVDTVGFIKDLPPDLTNAFNSTLEEIFFADLILLVFDASEPIPIVKSKLRTCTEILLPRMENQVLLVVANKCDLLSTVEKEKIMNEVPALIPGHPSLAISANTGDGIEDLRRMIDNLQKRDYEIDAVLSVTDSSMSLLSRLRSICQVRESFQGRTVEAHIVCKPEDGPRIVGWLRKAGAAKVTARQGEVPTNHTIGERVPEEAKGPPLSEHGVRS